MKRNLWAVGFAMLVLGFFLTAQYRVTQIANAPRPADLRAEELSRELTATKNKLQSTLRSNTELRVQIDKLAKADGVSPVVVPQRDVSLELLAGTRPAKGKGVILTVTAAKGRSVVVSEYHLWLLVQELRAAGAEGIAINRQRLTSMSEIRQITDSGRTMINGMYTAAPYEVDVVGNPQKLENDLKVAGGAVPRLALQGIHVQVVRSDVVELPSFGSPPDFQFLAVFP